jgi:small subunit ribosomal protein S20
MATHPSAEKRARQSLKRAERNRRVRSAVKTAARKVLESSPAEQTKALSEAFSVIQKSRGVFHRNAVRRKMARLAKASAKKAQKA